METQTTKKTLSEGKYTFCGATFAKNKITQHLKSCKQRRATFAAQEERSQETKTRLFHILAEGRYNPQYWLHFEVPASESLWDIDSFLKAMWIDDLDHLSGFTINGTSYGNDYPDDSYFFEEVGDKEEEEEVSEEEQEKELKTLVDAWVSQFMDAMPLRPDILVDADQHLQLTEWIAEIKKPRSVNDLVAFLKEELIRITKEEKLLLKDDQGIDIEARRKNYFRVTAQQALVNSLLMAVEDRSLDALLGNALKVGQKFSYIYDYGSSTYISLKVLTEREGIVPDKKKPVQLLAQNIAPTFVCAACGKPATTIEMGYYTESIAESAFCTKCANERDDEEEGGMLPIINSPRVGVL